jgi:hypothetical protein
MTSATLTPLQNWHACVRTKNLALLDALLDDNVIFHSPVVHRPQIGKAITFKYLAAALTVLNNETFTYLKTFENAQGAVLEFSSLINGIQLNGIDMISFNAEGKITEFKVMVRPLKAVNMLHQMMGEKLKLVTTTG